MSICFLTSPHGDGYLRIDYSRSGVAEGSAALDVEGNSCGHYMFHVHAGN
jgi:hypothetical protein